MKKIDTKFDKLVDAVKSRLVETPKSKLDDNGWVTAQKEKETKEMISFVSDLMATLKPMVERTGCGFGITIGIDKNPSIMFTLTISEDGDRFTVELDLSDADDFVKPRITYTKPSGYRLLPRLDLDVYSELVGRTKKLESGSYETDIIGWKETYDLLTNHQDEIIDGFTYLIDPNVNLTH